MTSDWGTDGGAELDLNTPVTPKSPGLNPNASVFLSKTPPSNQDNSQWEEESAHSTESTDNYQLVNGDLGKTEVGVAYPPTPESPAHTAEFTTAQESAPNPVAFTTVESNGNIEENGPLEGSIPDDQLRRLLQTQLEYYFSRDNLSHDTYLVSQMDSDQYVPILTVANFNQVKRLTNNMDLIVSVLRELANVQVDEKGERVRPNHNRCIVILREVPESTPLKDVENLFSGEKCPKFVSCEFAHNDSWYVTFESDETAQRAYQYLREDVKTFLGKPIMARIKAKTLIRTTMFRNGMKPQYDQQQTYPIQQQQPPQQQQRFNYPTTIQYLNGGQQAFQFPHYNTIMPTWTTMFDPSMVFAINGYQAQSVKINQNTGRHNFQSRPRNQKPNRQSSDRSLDNRMSHERYGGSSGGGSHRTSPRSLDGSQSSAGSVYHGRREGGPSQPHIHHPPVPAHLDSGLPAALPLSHPSAASAADNNNKEQSTLSQRGQKSYRSRRRREDEGPGGARNSRTNSSQLSTKDGRCIEPQFELESNSFPPLPGASNNSSTGDIFENKLSDVVKGTARPGQKDAGSKPQVASPPSPTTKDVNIPAATPASTSIINNNNDTPSITSVATTTTATTTALSASSTVTTTATTGPSVSSLAGSLPTPPPSPEKLDTKTETKHESRFEKSQKATHPHSGPAPNSSHSHAHTVGSKPEVKQAEPEVQSTVKQAMVNTQKSLSLEEKQPVKLSYAQMVQRRSESENGTTERPKSEEGTNCGSTAGPPGSPGGKDQVNHKPHTLKEQSQTTRQSPVNSRLPARDPIRKDSDPKEQRQFVGRRAKENRERRDRRKEREFEGRRSPNK